MSSTPDPEIAEKKDAKSPRSLPTGVLNALDDTVKEGITWIIENLLAEGDQMVVYGAPKVGKSQFALQLAMSVALGQPFLGWEIKEPKRVIYLNFEMGNRFFMHRVGKHFLYAQYPPESWSEIFPDPDSSEQLQWLITKEYTPLSQSLMQQINEGIEDCLFFTDGLRELVMPGNSPDSTANDKKKTEAANTGHTALIKQWHDILDSIKPDLIIFDTLSKTHSVNESDNSEIKDVLLRLRKISSVAVDAGAEMSKNSNNSNGRREIAHVIIHHARKQQGDAKRSNNTSVDNIRGASAIRAEADLIFGIYENNNGKYKKTQDGAVRANRKINMESRNLESLEMSATFNGYIFQKAAATESDDNKEELLRERFVEEIKKAFVQRGMRGRVQKSLVEEIPEELKKLTNKNRIKQMFQEFVKGSDADIQKRERKTIPDLDEYPCESTNSQSIYWIKDGSAWLKEKTLEDSIAKHKEKNAAREAVLKSARGKKSATKQRDKSEVIKVARKNAKKATSQKKAIKRRAR